MKTTILAAAAILALATGSAFAGDGPGGTAVQAESDLMNGVHSTVAAEYYGYQAGPVQQRQATADRGNAVPGYHWNSNG